MDQGQAKKGWEDGTYEGGQGRAGQGVKDRQERGEDKDVVNKDEGDGESGATEG